MDVRSSVYCRPRVCMLPWGDALAPYAAEAKPGQGSLSEGYIPGKQGSAACPAAGGKRLVNAAGRCNGGHICPNLRHLCRKPWITTRSCFIYKGRMKIPKGADI